MAKSPSKKTIATLTHSEEKRANIPTAEYQSLMQSENRELVLAAYERRNPDLDPQLVWRGKDMKDWADLVVPAPPLYIQEKVHPKVLIDDLLRHRADREKEVDGHQADLFGDFNGIPEGADRTEFYRHEQNWTNRMILGDSLHVMASLAEREGLRGKVQCIYFDPPYGIKFNSNFQWSTTSRDVKDGKADHITREPEQVKAFRDTWRDGIHSYLTYLRDRLTVARDLLTESGSIFVQIGDENVHRVRALMDEVFGEENFIQLIPFRKKLMPLGSTTLEGMTDYILYYCLNKIALKYRVLFKKALPRLESRWTGIEDIHGVRSKLNSESLALLPNFDRVYRLVSQRAPSYSNQAVYDFAFRGLTFPAPKGGSWVTTEDKMYRLQKAERLECEGRSLSYVYYFGDFPFQKINNLWDDTAPAQDKAYVVQTNVDVIQRCILMSTDPGDLVLDPTCGSGTSAFVAEQWGRRWITIDTSRVALALARARIMGARYPWYLLADSREGQLKEAELSRVAPSTKPVYHSIRQGFVYERVPHITLKSIANNAEIDVIWDTHEAHIAPLREKLGVIFGLPSPPEEWEIPRDCPANWSEDAQALHRAFWEARIARQKEIDASIAARADVEYLYDRPCVDGRRVRVAGPFTVESLSPHRSLALDEHDGLLDPAREPVRGYVTGTPFSQVVLDAVRVAGVQQAHKDGRIHFTALQPWPGSMVCAEGRFSGDQWPLATGQTASPSEKRAAIFIGPEFGTVQRVDLVEAAREAADAGFDLLITFAFNYEALTTEFHKLGALPVLKARIHADLHMAEDLKNTGTGNLFVVFGEPQIELETLPDGQLRVRVLGVDVFKPQTGEVVSDGPDGIACWFLDTDYNEESFFVRHAYFLGANDPYSSLKTTLKAEIDEEAWSTLHSAVSRPFPPPSSGRIAVKVINHLGDEVMKVWKV